MRRGTVPNYPVTVPSQSFTFEYGIKRTCNPETASDYAYVLAFALKGCGELNEADLGALSDEEKQALFDGVGAKALDDYTLQVTFNEPAAYNLNIIGMWVAHAMPKWIIEEKGDRWVVDITYAWLDPRIRYE